MNGHSKLIQSLQNPVLFPHKVTYFKVIETHISWVLLTGEYAYKIKKPLNLGFLDFSSLEKRHHFCLEEIRLNSRLAPGIYLEVVAIGGTEQQPTVDVSAGTICEYAVKMRQFEPDNTFDQLLARNKLRVEHMQQIAQIIATFHSKIARAANNTEYGSAETLNLPVQENFSQIQQLNDIDKSEVLQKLKCWSEQQFVMLLPLFKQRKQSDFIRECHGDLHLGDIALIAGQVVPFDGIEFNPKLYWIDVMSEIAFLVMDLQDKQRNDLAFQFLNEYLQYSGDYEGLQLLRFYLVYRAMVRAKVNAIRASQNICAEEKQQAIVSYHGYLHLANAYTQYSSPMLIIMHGVSGSGKSWLAEKIINQYQAIRVRSDVERKRLHQLSPMQKSASGLGANIYTPASSNITYQHLLQLATGVLKAGYNVIVDATFLQQQQRKLFFQQAELLQVPFLIIHTQASKQSLLRRIKDRQEQIANVSEANQAVLENQLNNMELLSHEELKYSITIDTDKPTHLPKLWKFIDDRCHA